MATYHRVPLWQSPLGAPKKGASADEAPIETHDETLFENPQFEHYEQTSNIQLFFDLFFVANLTTFTSQHEINSLNKLGSYIGFFCILWFTWCQVTLYDVRFATDSVIERIAHACHFGVMIGLAIVGPQFDPSSENWNSFQQLSLILMASRFVLFAQYGFTLLFTWRYRKTRLPLLIVMASLFIAAIIYLGLSFVFSTKATIHAYIGWYVVSICEVGINIAVAGKWQIVSFDKTHLVERMTCLTLIVLGEGVIGLTGRIALIEKFDFIFTSAGIGSIVSSLLIIYFVYQLYFDNVQLEQFGSIRQQIWAFLHFPFHMALVLLMEGINQFVIWRHIIEALGRVFEPLNSAIPDDLDLISGAFDVFNETAYNTLETYWPQKDETLVLNEIFTALDTLNPAMNATGNVTVEAATEASGSIILELFKVVLEDFGFEPPEDVAELAPLDQISAYYNVFTLVFGYFFTCAGLVLIGIAILSWLSLTREGRVWKNYIGIASNFLLGVGTCLLSIMLLTSASDNLGESPWTLPLLVFILTIALMLNHIPAIHPRKNKYPQP
ncbi:bacterial low temperature requirement A protein-domain-containing protein [Xylogone sp. PMI_703]|nr:bacterial low temperature requirement A protein-domain-containing protein [Xylogone sp. PMI_703]